MSTEMLELPEGPVTIMFTDMLVESCGDKHVARMHLERALEGFRRLDMPLHIGWTEDRLRSLD